MALSAGDLRCRSGRANCRFIFCRLIMLMVFAAASFSMMWNFGLNPRSFRYSKTSSSVLLNSFPVLFLIGCISIAFTSHGHTIIKYLFPLEDMYGNLLV